MIPISVPFIDQQDIDGTTEVLKSGMLVQHKNVQAFEAELKTWLSPSHAAVAVSNGTAALHLALLALGVGPGDQVIVPTYSWPATANAVELCGAKPIFVEIEEQTWGLNPKAFSEAIQKARANNIQIKAAIVVHAFGCPAKMDELLATCKEFNIPLIEDAACAIGSTWHQQNIGTLAALGCFSFHPRKVVTTGEGGMIATTSKEIDRQLRALRNHGQDPDSPTPDFILPGFNYRMTDIQGSLGRTQLKKLPEMLAKRRKFANLYIKELNSTSLTFQTPFPNTETNWQTFAVVLPQGLDRQTVVKKLADKGISAMMGTWHIPLIRYYKEKYGFSLGDFPVSDKIFEQSMSLPLHHKMAEDDILKIAKAVKENL